MQSTPPHLIAALSAPITSNDPIAVRKGIITTVSDFNNFDVFGLRENSRLKRVAHESLEHDPITLDRPRYFVPAALDGFRKLEKEVASFFACSDALLFSSRNQALFSLFSLILNEQDILLTAPHATGPLAEVSALTGAGLLHTDVYSEDATYLSGKANEFIFVETIHPLTFESFAIPTVTSPLLNQGRPVIFDESLALGVLGTRGLGVTEDLRTAANFNFTACILDCSVAFGQQGCFVASSAELIQALRERSRTYQSEIPIANFFSKTISETFLLLPGLKQQRVKLAQSAQALALDLQKMSLKTQQAGCYVSIIFEKFTSARKVSQALRERGILTSYGLTQRHLSNQSSVRIILSTKNNEKDIAGLLEGIYEITRR